MKVSLERGGRGKTVLFLKKGFPPKEHLHTAPHPHTTHTSTRRAVISVVTALLIALAVGYLWELFEYAGDSVLGMNNQRWENGFIGELPDGTFIVNDPRGNAIIDTMTDMLCNFCGALVCFVPSLIAFLKKPSLIDNFSLIRMPRA